MESLGGDMFRVWTEDGFKDIKVIDRSDTITVIDHSAGRAQRDTVFATGSNVFNDPRDPVVFENGTMTTTAQPIINIYDGRVMTISDPSSTITSTTGTLEQVLDVINSTPTGTILQDIRIDPEGNYVATTSTSFDVDGDFQPLNLERMLKMKMKRNLNMFVKCRRTSDNYLLDPQELKARHTLRDLITERDYRRYLTNNFIVVRGTSGKHYQIFGSHSQRIQVYENGKKIAALCIHTDRKCPPTDHVLNMKMMIEYEEQYVWDNSNVSRFRVASNLTVSGHTNLDNASLNLLEYYKSLKTA